MASKKHRPTSDKELQACSGGAGQSDQGKKNLTVKTGETRHFGEGDEHYDNITTEPGSFTTFG